MASLQLQNSWLSSLTRKPNALFPSKTSPFKVSLSANQSNKVESSPETTPEPEPDPVKLAFEKAKSYKKIIEESSKVANFEENPVGVSAGTSIGSNGESKEVPDSVKVALEKAKEYKKNKGVVAGGVKDVSESETSSGLKGGNARNSGSKSSDLEGGSSRKKEKLSVSSIDFVGLGFADKKIGRGLPAGLIPLTEPIPGGNLPDVEIIVGDTSKFADDTTSMSKPTQEDTPELYKPKVSTWGVFPRPENISKTFGGGRTIRPGDVIETAEERAAKDERTKQLIAAYRKQIGLNIDPKVKLECEKALKEGDSLMDSGKLNEAIQYYEDVMDKLPFKSELHGLAALQWSICQDSLNRSDEARVLYEKLQSHPNAKVSKQARQFLFSFQAMEMMKVTGSDISPINPGFESYFEKFVEDKGNYPAGAASIGESSNMWHMRCRNCSYRTALCGANERVQNQKFTKENDDDK